MRTTYTIHLAHRVGLGHQRNRAVFLRPNNEQQPPTVPITPTYPPYYVVPRPQEPERSDANEAFRALLSNNTNVLASNSTAYFAYLLGNSKK